jgi:hypothetical protein
MATALVSSDYRAWWVASDCTTVIMGITDAGVLETLAGFNIDVDFSTGKAITVDIDVPLASDTYVYGMDIDLQQTAAYAGTWSTSGGMIALRSDVHVDMQITDAYAGYFNVYVDPASTCTVNDAVGVLANVTLVGPFTQGAATSSIAALKGMISNTCTGSYDGQVFNLMLSYGSNVNYSDTTAMIYAYTHGDARCDYGFYMLNYSPYMSAGLTLTEQNTSASMLCGIDVDVNAIGADANYYGMDLDLTQRTIASGAYLSRGNLTGSRSDCYAIGNIDHVYASRSGATLTMSANTETNQFYGGIFSSSVSGAFTLALNDGVVGAQFAVSVASNVVDITTGSVTAGLVAAGFFFPNVLTPITAVVYGAYIKCTNYCDYGAAVIVESNNISAGLQVRTKDSAVLPIGLDLACTSGSITAAFAFPAEGTNPVINSVEAGDANGGSIRITIDGTARYLHYWNAAA